MKINKAVKGTSLKKAFELALADKAFQAFKINRMFNTAWYDDKDKFRKSAWFSVHPTVKETGIGIGGFKKPTDQDLNVDTGDFAEVDWEGSNDGIIVKVLKYAGENPWWKGYQHYEDATPCWIVESITKPFEVSRVDSSNNEYVKLEWKLPIPDFCLEKIDKPLIAIEG